MEDKENFEQTGEERERVVSKKKRYIGLTIGAIGLAALFFGIGWFGHWLSLGKGLRNLLWVVDTARNHYYQDLTDDDIFDAFLDCFELDPYTEYYTKEEYDAQYSSNAGSAQGIGISVIVEADMVRLYRISGNSPAEKAGLQAGMYVLAYGSNEGELKPAKRTQLLDFIRAQQGSFVLQCGFDKDGADARIFTVTPASYRVAYCLYRDSAGSFRFNPENLGQSFEAGEPLPALGADTAYIRISEFHGTAAEEFASCLSLMKERGRKHLVLDLRANGGGYMDVFCEISTYLMKNASGKKPVAATARYRSGKEVAFTASGNSYHDYFTDDAKIYILADENTASASECLIGALVSYGTVSADNIYLRGDGTEAHTYGKGIMQSHFTDYEGNVLKLTVAEVFWPNGTSIHGVGVVAKDELHGIDAPQLPSETDAFLDTFLARIRLNA